MALLEISNLTVEFPVPVRNGGGGDNDDNDGRIAVRGASLRVERGQVTGVVGESGAGKSTIGAAMLDLLEPPGRITAGTIRLNGEALPLGNAAAMRKIRGRRIAAIFQDPLTALDPLFTVADQLTETLRCHRPELSTTAARREAIALLEEVGVADAAVRADDYPHQFSGGMRQRAVIALALAGRPEMLIADEPTTALDVSLQARVLKLLRRQAAERGIGVLLITHDMGAVAETADRVEVMRRGEIVESGPAEQILLRPQHDYSRALLAAVPPPDRKLHRFILPATTEARADDDAPDDNGDNEARRRRLLESRPPPTTNHGGNDGNNGNGGNGGNDGNSGNDGNGGNDGRGGWAGRGGVGGRGGWEGREVLLEVRGLRKSFGGGWLARRAAKLAVDDVGFSLAAGETLGLVGESGSGKTTIARVVAGLTVPDAGRIVFAGRELSGESGRRARELRRGMQMIFQDPYSSLNPRLRTGFIVAEPLLAAGRGLARREALARARDMLALAGLPPDAADKWPHEFSGGQRQRVAIARALVTAPRLLICDEPTSALDVSIQARILNLVKDLQERLGLALLFITHDLPVARQMCDRIGVLKNGRLLELRETETFFAAPQTEYAAELLRLIPQLPPREN